MPELSREISPESKAVILDRDGTLNRDIGYLIDFERFELLPGVEAALRLIQGLGFRLFAASNQSGVARDYFTFAEVEKLHGRIVGNLAEKGIRLEEIAFCPHHPEGKVAEFALDCDCRKPKPGLILRLAEKHGLDLAGSYMVGDKPGDALAGLNAGAAGVWLKPVGAADWLDKPANIKEFESLPAFAEGLKRMDEVSRVIEEKYRSGRLNGISAHLLEFVARHKQEIRAMAGNPSPSAPSSKLLDAAKTLIQHRGSIHLPSELADQIKEINNEIWYRGEHGDYNRSQIKEEWAMKYAAMWRDFRIKEILYVADHKAAEIATILNRA